MPWTPATFRTAKPEFAPTSIPDAVIAQALADAVVRCDARVFGTSTDAAVGLLAAHLLALSPFGQGAQVDPKSKKSGSTTYYEEWERLAAQRAGGGWSAGQSPAGFVLGGCGGWR